MLVRSFLSAGVDTTINGIGNALLRLAHHPEQYAKLHADPALARPAFEEALRCESTVQTFFRTTARDTEIAGAPIPREHQGACLSGLGQPRPAQVARARPLRHRAPAERPHGVRLRHPRLRRTGRGAARRRGGADARWPGASKRIEVAGPHDAPPQQHAARARDAAAALDSRLRHAMPRVVFDLTRRPEHAVHGRLGASVMQTATGAGVHRHRRRMRRLGDVRHLPRLRRSAVGRQAAARRWPTSSRCSSAPRRSGWPTAGSPARSRCRPRSTAWCCASPNRQQ